MRFCPLKTAFLVPLIASACTFTAGVQAHEGAKEEAPSAATDDKPKAGYVAVEAAPIPSPKAPKHPLPLAAAKVEDIVKQLDPKSLKRTKKKKTFPPGTLELAIEFKNDSDQFSDNGLPLLEHLSAALQDPRLLNANYLIEGHTDARGSTRYSFSLSKQQADAVRVYLVAHGVAANRLRTEGKGFKEPQDESNPLASSNRRIRVVLERAD